MTRHTSAISFSPRVGRATKATETTISNLGNFCRGGEGCILAGDVYSTSLIGDENGGKAATRPDNVSSQFTGVWTLEDNVFGRHRSTIGFSGHIQRQTPHLTR